MSNGPPPAPSLIVRKGPKPDQVFQLNKNVLTIGNTQENDIIIQDGDVSPHHAILTRKSGDWILEDLGSKSGTWVNGKRITKGIVLRQGTRIDLGPNVVLTAEGEALGPTQPAKKGGCGKTAVLVIAVVALLGILLASAAAVGYYYFSPRYTIGPPTSETFAKLGPAVTIQMPNPDTVVPVGSSFLVFVNARDEKGVTRIDLWVDDQVAITQSSPDANGVTPFSLIHNMLAEKAGSHVLVAHAFNREGDMGASLAIVVTVSDQEEVADDTAVYIAEEGDTLESIANKSNNTVAAIKDANPGIKSSVNKNRKVNIPNPPHPDLPKPPAQPGGRIDWLPGIKPGWIVEALPGLIPGLPEAQISDKIKPNLVPDWSKIQNPPNVSIKSPDPLKAAVKDCTVTLTWKDNADNNTEYQVFRRRNGQPELIPIDRKDANAETHIDTVEGPGKYEYIVGAINSKGPSDKNGWSSYVSVEVKPTDNCKQIPTFKQVHFQPLSFETSDGTYGRAFMEVGVGNITPIRIPAPQQDNFAPGKLDASYKRIFPLPVEVYNDPSSKIPIYIHGIGVLSDKTPNGLGNSNAVYSFSELISANARNVIRQGSAGAGFNATYKLWIEDTKWTGKGTTDKYPPPTNLRLSAESSLRRDLDWDYDPQYADAIDGFILYRQYSCPGEDSTLKWPKMVKKGDRKFTTFLSEEPPGCVCKFQMSAIGAFGETKLSDPPKERCQTRPSNYALDVTFQNLRIDGTTLPQPAASEIYLFANEFTRKSSHHLLEAKNYDLKVIPLNGSPGNNKITVSLAESERILLSFYVADICKGDLRAFYKPSTSWENINETINLASADNGCQVAVNIMDSGGGSQAPIGKEPTVYLASGDTCDLNWQCRSGVCESGRCVPNGDGKKGEYCFTNNHCENNFCNCLEGRDGKNCRGWEKPGSWSGLCAAGNESGDRCSQNIECASGYCANNWRCAPKDKTGRLGDFCFHDEHCGSGTCYCAWKGHDGAFCKEWDDNTEWSPPTDFGFCDEWEGPPNGSSCKDSGDCKSNYCANGVCAPRNGSGLKNDYCHHNDHCFSGSCVCGEGAEKDLIGVCVIKNTNIIGVSGTCFGP